MMMSNTTITDPTESYFENVSTGVGRDLPQNYAEYRIGAMLLPIQTIVFVVLGTAGNLVSLVGFSTRDLRRSSSSVYLRCLAVFDTCTLWGYLLYMVQRVYRPQLVSSAFCRFTTYLTSSGQTLSALTVMCMTVERFLAVRWPLYITFVFTRANAALNLLVLTVFILGTHLHYWWTVSVVYRPASGLHLCGIPQDYIQFHNVWGYIDVTFGVFLPMGVALLFNILIFLTLRSARRKAHTLTASHGGGSGEPGPSSAASRQTTTMLVTVSVAFIILITPYAVCYVLISISYFDTEVAHQYAQAFLFQQLSLACLMCNHSVNGMLYAVTGRRFRDELLLVVTSKLRRRRWRRAMARYDDSPSRSPGASMTQLTSLSLKKSPGHQIVSL